MQSGLEVLCNQAQQMREMLRNAALSRGKVLYSGLRHTSSGISQRHRATHWIVMRKAQLAAWRARSLRCTRRRHILRRRDSMT